MTCHVTNQVNQHAIDSSECYECSCTAILIEVIDGYYMCPNMACDNFMEPETLEVLTGENL